MSSAKKFFQSISLSGGIRELLLVQVKMEPEPLNSLFLIRN